MIENYLFGSNLVEGFKSKSEILSNPNNHSFLDKLQGIFKGLHYRGIESWRVRRDFQYMIEAGFDNGMNAFEKYPRFDSQKENKDYIYFLIGKLK